MKHFYSSTLVFTLLILSVTNCTDNKMSCVLKGRVSGRDSDTLYLLKATEDLRFAQTIIPISDSAFEYKFNIGQPEAFALVFKDELDKGAIKPIYFFPHDGEINFKLNSLINFEKNQIDGGKLNNVYENYIKLYDETFKSRQKALTDSARALSNRNEFYSEEMSKLVHKMRSVQENNSRQKILKGIEILRSSGNYLSPKAKDIEVQGEVLSKEVNNWRLTYFEKNPSIVTYFLLFLDAQELDFKQLDLNKVKKCYTIFAKKFPDHPYTSEINDILNGVERIRLGGKYIDFKLPDVNGKEFSISEIIKDKIALIDLWATWCGPCIKSSRLMIPIYEEFKGKGFTICGIAAEIKNTENLKNTLEREKFPWVNLIDLDQKNHIWDIYGIANSGGRMYLVDKDGTILAIDPSAEKVKEILKEKL